jgi:hypothetical protein
MKVFLLFVLSALAVMAQVPAPELAAQSAAHKEASQSLSEQRNKALAELKTVYLTALESADQSATAAGNVAAVAAITKERELMQRDLFGADIPSDLPKSLQSARRAYAKGREKVVNEFAQRQKAIDGNYLRFLATIQPKAATNRDLALQILNEKQRIMAGITGPISDLRT